MTCLFKYEDPSAYVQSKSNDNVQEQNNVIKKRPKLCWFGMNCYRGSRCTFTHSNDYAAPPQCRYENCTRDDCVFKHVDDCMNRSSCNTPGCNLRHTKGKSSNIGMHNCNNTLRMVESSPTFMENNAAVGQTYMPVVGMGLPARPLTVDTAQYKYPVKRLSQFYGNQDSSVVTSNSFNSNMPQEMSQYRKVDPKNWMCR